MLLKHTYTHYLKYCKEKYEGLYRITSIEIKLSKSIILTGPSPESMTRASTLQVIFFIKQYSYKNICPPTPLYYMKYMKSAFLLLKLVPTPSQGQYAPALNTYIHIRLIFSLLLHFLLNSQVLNYVNQSFDLAISHISFVSSTHKECAGWSVMACLLVILELNK